MFVVFSVYFFGVIPLCDHGSKIVGYQKDKKVSTWYFWDLNLVHTWLHLEMGAMLSHVLFTSDVKKLTSAADDNVDIDAKCEQGFKASWSLMRWP